MKKLLSLAAFAILLAACTPAEKAEETAKDTTTPSVQMPYTADYSSDVSQEVSDQDVLAVLNSYKAWENGDMKALRATLSDTVSFNAWDGFKYEGLADGLLKRWASSRDSISSVKIKMHVWAKNHFVDKKSDVVTVWYTEIDTYKNGKIDSAYWADVNIVQNGKIRRYLQYRQAAK